MKRIRPLWRVKRNRSICFALHNRINFLDFSSVKGNKFLNSVFTKILKIKSSF
jgi:hypothetical protein